MSLCTERVSRSLIRRFRVALEHALIRTLAMLQQHGLATAEDCNQVAKMVKRDWLSGKGADPIDYLAKLSSGSSEMLDATV